MTIALARQLAPVIRVNAVAPGFVATRWMKNLLGEQRYNERIIEQAKITPVGKTAYAEDIAEMVCWFIDGPDLITGEVLPIDYGTRFGKLICELRDSAMDLELTGKRALVTGGSRGIGKAIALQLAQEGVDVAIAARNLAPLEATAREIAAATGRKIVPIVADMGDDAAVESLVAKAVQALGGIDILVNDAAAPGGTVPSAKIEQVTSRESALRCECESRGLYARGQGGRAAYGEERLGPHHQYRRRRGAAQRQLHRLGPQCRGLVADQESRRRARPQRHQRRRHPSRHDAKPGQAIDRGIREAA